MKYILICLIALISVSCNQSNQTVDNQKTTSQITDNNSIPLILSDSLENRRAEFQTYVDNAQKNIQLFSKKYAWEQLAEEDFMDSVMIFDNKNRYNIELLKLAGADTSIQLPDTYCAALERRTLVSISPEYYAKVYSEGIEEKSFEKLLTHEIAHSLHIRILNGDEDAMGPVWFYEGFAMYVANQFSQSEIEISSEEMQNIMNDPERGSYMNYNYIFRHFAKELPLQELILKAKNESFNEELILLLK